MLRANPEVVLDLIYKEVLLRCGRGEKPGFEEYARRLHHDRPWDGRGHSFAAMLGYNTTANGARLRMLARQGVAYRE
jgi:hypothetical protein